MLVAMSDAADADTAPGVSTQEPAVDPPRPPPAKDMLWVPGGEFLMGCDDFYPEERPVHRVMVDGFWMDEHPVTVAEFRRFVKATGHVTWAEQSPDPADYPTPTPSCWCPARSCFSETCGTVDLADVRNWWSWTPGGAVAPSGRAGHHAARPRASPGDARRHRTRAAYAAWVGKQLPTEAQWERAARGGLEGKIFCWGDEFAPRGKLMANTWQGEFPWQNLMLDRYERTSPVKRFPPNGYGLYDMAGNVWEWTRLLHPRHSDAAAHPCCCAAEPARQLARSELRARRPRRAHPPSRDQGRLAPVRSQLLPALPTCRTPGRGHRHHHKPHRISLHHPCPSDPSAAGRRDRADRSMPDNPPAS